jgi:hypothetical protein
MSNNNWLFSKRLLFLIVLMYKAVKVDLGGRCETPAGEAGQVRPHRRKPRRLTARPAESEQPGTQINLPQN